MNFIITYPFVLAKVLDIIGDCDIIRFPENGKHPIEQLFDIEKLSYDLTKEQRSKPVVVLTTSVFYLKGIETELDLLECKDDWRIVLSNGEIAEWDKIEEVYADFYAPLSYYMNGKNSLIDNGDGKTIKCIDYLTLFKDSFLH